jgi:prepilin-type N-terminal cleavage/methylation domain-containing protein
VFYTESTMFHELIHNITQLVYQPALRRGAFASVGAGFTIVELLIVIVIIAVLAAIVVVAYNGMTTSATTSAVKNELASIHRKLTVYKETGTGYYPDISEIASADLVKVNKTNLNEFPDRNNFYYCRNADNTMYALGVITKNNVNLIMANGSIQETNSTVWGSSTCSSIGAPNSANSGWVPASQWQSWVKG